MSKARNLADLLSDGAELADGQISVAEVVGAAPLANPTFTGTASGTFSGPLTGNVTGNITGNVTGAVTGDVTAPEIDLTAISSTISDTAVDIFVYDTSKDSDGGAWRKRTQHTSWYNETLNTATRGSRKEFPSVAVIVAESNKVTIYDGDDPDMPMWMVFFCNAGSVAMLQASTIKAVSALNGVLQIASDVYGAPQVRFLEDNGDVYWNASSRRFTPFGIADRNANDSPVSNDTSRLLVNSNANDVAMTVLPNAPIDAATGLPMPTIAVATDGGVSVIKDDETVVDFVVSGWTTVVGDLEWDEDNLIINAANGNTLTNIWYIEDAASRQDIGDLGSATGIIRFGRGQSFASYNTPAISAYSGVIYTRDIEKTEGSNFAIATNNNTDYDVLNLLDVTNNAVCYIASDYNTGWMNGDIKLATLSDTDDTDVTGSELVTNGTFDTDVSGWTAYNGATLSVVSGALRVTPDADGAGAQQSITTVSGKKYVLSGQFTVSGGQGRITVETSGGSTLVNSGNVASFVGGLTFTASGSTTVIKLNSNGGTSYTDFDNISVRLAEADRSVNGNGLQVFGTVTKNPVATGADLVAYSGFSTSNYLRQPYNSDFDFGTGNFSCAVWCYISSDTTHGNFILSRRQDSGGNGFALYIGGAGDHTVRFQTSDGTATTVASTQTINVGSWNFISASRINTTTVQISVNGQDPEYLDTASRNVDVTDGTPLNVGINYNLSATSNVEGSIALARISATAPSPEQIKKIYEDEKVLFQDGAQATLYGSSDAVTALAYDDSTELLHVGTSAGRSVFQGLRRVDNTTDAVGAAISASNGLVAED